MLRMALVGCGGMARTHRERFGALGDRMKLTATVDLDIERAREAAEATGAPLATADLDEALPHCDAVLLSIPHHEHHPIGMRCLAAGKHVLMEKPLANTEAECIELIDEADRRGLTLMVGYCMRFHPLVVRVKELIDARTYGECFHVSIWTEQHTEFPPDSWASSAAKLGGGQFFSHGCHYVDILLHYLGNPVTGLHVGTNLGTPWMEREGTSDAVIRFESGALGYHAGTWGAKGSRLGYAIHAQCTEGMIEADISHGKLAVLRDGGEEVLLEGDAGSKYQEKEIAHFIDCVETGARPLTDGPSSLQGLRVIWRMYEAERTGVMADLRGLGLDQPWR